MKPQKFLTTFLLTSSDIYCIFAQKITLKQKNIKIMKKSILLIAVAMMLVLSQCKKNDIGKNNNEIGNSVIAVAQGPDIERIQP